jgi:hypothetical protein
MATEAQPTMTRENTIKFAMDYVTNDRNIDNGNPEDNFSAIAELWTFWLEKKYGITFKLTATDVAMLSLMIKIARLLVTETKHDNWIDIVGYAACGAETASIEERNKRWNEAKDAQADGGPGVMAGGEFHKLDGSLSTEELRYLALQMAEETKEIASRGG